MVRRGLAAAVLAAALCVPGCSVQEPVAPKPGPQVAPAPAHPLPFRLSPIQGAPAELPPAVAMSLGRNTHLTFSYREELTHGEEHTPLYLSAFNPATYFGVPLGQYTVTADATLSIFDGNRAIGDYHAQATVSESYNLYAEPTHLELETAARTEVRNKIDRELYGDAARLAHAAASPPSAQAHVPAAPRLAPRPQAPTLPE